MLRANKSRALHLKHPLNSSFMALQKIQPNIPFLVSDCNNILSKAQIDHASTLAARSGTSNQVYGSSDETNNISEDFSGRGNCLLESNMLSVAALFNPLDDLMPVLDGASTAPIVGSEEIFWQNSISMPGAIAAARAEVDYVWMPFKEQQQQEEEEHHQSATSPYAKGKRRRTKSKNTTVGYCQHPKHVSYRSDTPGYQALSTATAAMTTTTTTPRRGRPPKGTKPIDRKRLVTDDASSSVLTGESSLYPGSLLCKMTIRPLPKRLEAVVGRKDIRVCLTCLKKSDADLEYLGHPAYRAPQVHGKMKRV